MQRKAKLPRAKAKLAIARLQMKKAASKCCIACCAVRHLAHASLHDMPSCRGQLGRQSYVTAMLTLRQHLSNSVASARKLQNRVAQREFRQRKLQYVKDLEARVEFLSSSKDDQLEALKALLRGALACFI